jgi:cell shape-determining protein MreC
MAKQSRWGTLEVAFTPLKRESAISLGTLALFVALRVLSFTCFSSASVVEQQVRTHISVNTAPILNIKGWPRGVLATFNDMTDLEKNNGISNRRLKNCAYPQIRI